MEWFSSPYYPILYAHRDKREAETFVQALIEREIFSPAARVLDAGCGAGRLSFALAESGFVVDAIDQADFIRDLAAENSYPGLQFFQADYTTWRPPYLYDGIISFFTSLGYQESLSSLISLLKNWHTLLKPKGLVIIDYLNIFLRNPIPYETQQTNGIKFVIQRAHDTRYLCKKIEVHDRGEVFTFQERILKLTQGDWFYVLERARFRVREIWGSYEAHPFDVYHSPRLIIFAQKDAHLS